MLKSVRGNDCMVWGCAFYLRLIYGAQESACKHIIRLHHVVRCVFAAKNARIDWSGFIWNGPCVCTSVRAFEQAISFVSPAFLWKHLRLREEGGLSSCCLVPVQDSDGLNLLKSRQESILQTPHSLDRANVQPYIYLLVLRGA